MYISYDTRFWLDLYNIRWLGWDLDYEFNVQRSHMNLDSSYTSKFNAVMIYKSGKDLKIASDYLQQFGLRYLK